jgi:hypothetical protein
VGEARVVGED